MEELSKHWEQFFHAEREDSFWKRKKQLWKKRNGDIIRIRGQGQIYERNVYENHKQLQYLLHLTFLIKQKGHFHIEEQVLPFKLLIWDGNIIRHEAVEQTRQEEKQQLKWPDPFHRIEHRFSYDRRAAVQYAERWWNSYNPQYRRFDDDCTNYISQCLRAGGAPMWGSPSRETGWWYTGNNWSFSWAVAHSFRWYLSGSEQGMKGTEVSSPDQLTYGDVICYDFEGDGRWDHTTIVTAKDAYGMPLVNAHTNNSRHRYWSYEDSMAWTENTKYKFFRIGD